MRLQIKHVIQEHTVHKWWLLEARTSANDTQLPVKTQKSLILFKNSHEQ